MRLSLWQQFSSNNSSYYTVVGEFMSHEAAQEAASKLRQFFRDVNAWFDRPDNADVKKEREDGDLVPLSDPEKEVSNLWGIPWYEYSIDWYPSDHNVAVIDHLVFVQPNDTWQGGRPLAAMLAKYGGKGMVDGDVDDFDNGGENRTIHFRLRCVAPNALVAQSIADQMNTYVSNWTDIMRNARQDENHLMFAMPWKTFETQPLSTAFFRGQVTAHENEITIDELGFHNLGYGAPALVAWLRSLGCTDFYYDLTEEIESEED
jgi:hypothetical protein